jgi:hypothetical protein
MLPGNKSFTRHRAGTGKTPSLRPMIRAALDATAAPKIERESFDQAHGLRPDEKRETFERQFPITRDLENRETFERSDPCEICGAVYPEAHIRSRHVHER